MSLCEEQPAPAPDSIVENRPWWTPESMPADPPATESAENYPSTQWTAGLKWHRVIDSCMDYTEVGPTVYNGLWSAHEWLVNLMLMILYAATHVEVLEFFTEGVTGVIDSLKESIFEPLLPSVIFLGALYMAWVGLIRKRATLTFQSAVWMCTSLGLGMWVMAAPNTFFGLTVSVANSGAAASTAIISKGLNGTDGYHCLPDDTTSMQWDEESPSDYAARLYRDTLWQSMLCEPWKLGMFGANPTEKTENGYGPIYLEMQAKKWESGDDPDAYQEKMDEVWTKGAENIKENDPNAHRVMIGDEPSARYSAVTSALAADLIVGGLVVFCGLGVLVQRLVVLLLLMASPIVFLIGAHPSWGMPILRRYGETILAAALKQAALLALLGVVLVFVRGIAALNLSWPLTILLYGLMFAAVIYGWVKLKTGLGTASQSMAGSPGRILGSVAGDETLSTVSGVRAAKWARRKERELSREIAPLVSAAVGGALPTPKGGAPKPPKPNAGRPPEDAPPLRPEPGDRTHSTASETAPPPRPRREPSQAPSIAAAPPPSSGGRGVARPLPALPSGPTAPSGGTPPRPTRPQSPTPSPSTGLPRPAAAPGAAPAPPPAAAPAATRSQSSAYVARRQRAERTAAPASQRGPAPDLVRDVEVRPSTGGQKPLQGQIIRRPLPRLDR